jgi:hypothetical protein
VTVDLHFSRPLQFDTIDPDSISVFYRTTARQKTAIDFSLLLVDQTLYLSVNNLPEQATHVEVFIHNSELQPLLDKNHHAFDGDSDENQGGGYSYVYPL